METSTATTESNQRNSNTNDVLKGEAASGAQNIQALTLYIYQKQFIVAFSSLSCLA